jgi:hypothetical protein
MFSLFGSPCWIKKGFHFSVVIVQFTLGHSRPHAIWQTCVPMNCGSSSRLPAAFISLAVFDNCSGAAGDTDYLRPSDRMSLTRLDSS